MRSSRLRRRPGTRRGNGGVAVPIIQSPAPRRLATRQSERVANNSEPFMPSPRKALLAFILSMVMALAAMAAFFVLGDLIFLLIGAPLGGVAISWLRRLAAPRPSLTLSSRGIRVRDVAFIEWENLQGLEVFPANARFLAFHVTDADAVRLAAPPWKRLWLTLNGAVERAPATLTENMIEGKFEDVVPAILSHKDVPVTWRG